MFNKNVFTQKDPIADLVKPMLEAQAKAKMEELKGNQKVLDKNKNNKLDSQDFAILRGEKKTVKEEEQVDEASPFDWKKPREPEVKGGAGVKAGRAYGGAAQKSKPEHDDADDKKKTQKEEVEQLREFGDLPKIGMTGNHPGPFGVYHRHGKGEDDLKIVSKHKTLDSALKHVHRLEKKTGKKHVYGNLLAHKPEHGEIPKKFNEEVEQIDELSVQTMKSAKEKLANKAYDAHMDDNKYAARHYAGRALNVGDKIKKKERQIAKEEVEQVEERSLTSGETAEKERIVKGMKKSLAGFKTRYGDRAKSVMYATATKQAKKD